SHFNWFGMDPGALRGRHVSEIIGESAYRALKPHYEEALRDGTSTYLGEVPYARGGKRYIHGTAVVGRSPAGDADGIVVLVSDLTEHKLMERALDASTRRSQAVLDTAVDGIIIIDENGVIGSFNPGAEKLFGYSAREVIGRNVKMLMPQAYAENHDAYLYRYLETGERRIIGIGREVSGLRKDGSEIPLDLAVGEFIESGRRYFAGFTRDISARKSAEREARARLNELAHVTRVSAMGDLASGIAHEVNQPLTAIVTMTQALLRSFRAGRAGQSLLEETLEKIVRQGRRASSILQQMREFIGKEKTEDLGLHDVDEIVSGVVQLFSHEFDYYGIRVRTKFGCAQARVRVNRIQIEQVMVNLVQNAVQAMTDVAKERVLTLRTHRPVQEPRHVEVSVVDTGVGLPPGSEGRIFEPFFTTRAKGLGQGLSISRSIIDAHGGTIRAAANGDAGTTFVFTLPLATAAEP
ncbi:MAG: PAS domain S-box protein, partial [Gammaproteobacteria bacterium]|nr:PAS domain S-box protein [Gammaproteobacteria bacterium]